MGFEQPFMLDIYLSEYEQLKREQIQRIGFRDNLLYVTLGLYGVVLGFIWGEQPHSFAMLVLPWISLILGWNYLMNDQKISAIGQYIHGPLSNKLAQVSRASHPEFIFHWETIHRLDPHRLRHKIEQLVIDELTFVISGLTALIMSGQLIGSDNFFMSLLAWAACILLIILGIEIFVQTHFSKKR